MGMEIMEMGTRNAAITANNFLKKNRHLMSEEESHALRVLIAAAIQNPDQKPRLWHCDTYCRNVRHVSCEGEFCMDPEAVDKCPYLDEMLY